MTFRDGDSINTSFREPRSVDALEGARSPSSSRKDVELPAACRCVPMKRCAAYFQLGESEAESRQRIAYSRRVIRYWDSAVLADSALKSNFDRSSQFSILKARSLQIRRVVVCEYIESRIAGILDMVRLAKSENTEKRYPGASVSCRGRFM